MWNKFHVGYKLILNICGLILLSYTCCIVTVLAETSLEDVRLNSTSAPNRSNESRLANFTTSGPQLHSNNPVPQSGSLKTNTTRKGLVNNHNSSNGERYQTVMSTDQEIDGDLDMKGILDTSNKTDTKRNKNVGYNHTSKDKRAKKLLVSFFDSESEEIKNNTNTSVKVSRTTNVSPHSSSSDINKRTKLVSVKDATAPVARQLQNVKQNNQIVLTTLASGKNAASPQHVQVSNQPTHVMFKPVHKYLAPIHRYMTQPIHRYLSKPVSLSGLTHKITSPQVQAGVPQNRQITQPQNPGPLLQDAIPGGLATGRAQVQGGAQHMTPPVQVYARPRLQPVLLHANKLSLTGYGPCSTNPCKNGGICSSVTERPLCICRPGFRGRFCELINRCYPNPCHNFGTCTEIERDFQCTCKKEFRGKKCEVENKCEPNPCNNGGTCSEIDDDYVCMCREGFLGHSCEIESKCSPINPCKNGATCQEAGQTYKCFCRNGFTGYNCEARITHAQCFPNPCSNGGLCTITGTSTGNYTCSCVQGWKGQACTEKVDNWGNTFGPSICTNVNPCMFGGTCAPISYYDYKCTCPAGRGGSRCEHNLVRQEPSHSCAHCHAYARCLNDKCKCVEGYEGDGDHCISVQHYCHPNPCYNGGTCREQNNPSQTLSDGKKWWCECPSGFSGKNCQEMDLCHAHICQNGGICLSNNNEAKCLCKKPFEGKYCEEKDVCVENQCRNGGSCKDIDGVATCYCRPEYDGLLCDHWKCSDCDANASCKEGICVCNNNYTGDGKTCRMEIPAPTPTLPPFQLAIPIHPSPMKFCSSSPCDEGATCIEAVGTYYCVCPENKYGKKCDETSKVIADLCSKCDIDATCQDGRCVCNAGYTGSGFSCRKSAPVPEESIVKEPHRSGTSCDFCPENGQCLKNVCVCPPGFQNVKRSCLEIDMSGVTRALAMKAMPPGVAYVGLTRNKLPIGQWKEDSVVSEYKSLGCWADTKQWRNPVMRAMKIMEGLHPSLNDNYEKRQNPITKCAEAAKAYGYKMFAVQNGGQCFSGAHAEQSYTTYGPSQKCRFGVGGPLANDVYKL